MTVGPGMRLAPVTLVVNVLSGGADIGALGGADERRPRDEALERLQALGDVLQLDDLRVDDRVDELLAEVAGVLDEVGATASAFNEPSVADFHSPKSTYFYKIHGLVDYWWQQWHAPKSRIKDVIDSDPKRFVVDKVQLAEHKQFQKDVIPDGKGQFKEIKEKDKDKGGSSCGSRSRCTARARRRSRTAGCSS